MKVVGKVDELVACLVAEKAAVKVAAKVDELVACLVAATVDLLVVKMAWLEPPLGLQ